MSDTYVGGLGPDSHTGTEQAMYGLDGSDNLDALDNIFTFTRIYGGDGDDVLNYRDNATQFAHIYGGDGNDNLDGGQNADSLYGDEGSDLATGADGSDLIFGGTGNDSLWGFWNLAESANDGNDEIYGGPGDDDLHGQVGRDTLSGNSGNNSLSGGAGKDILTGGSGADHFIFDAPLDVAKADRITDFSVRDDTITLLHDEFLKACASGTTLPDAKFYRSPAAHDPSDRIIYNPANGVASYDSDGTGHTAPIQFAILARGLPLTHLDFVVA